MNIQEEIKIGESLISTLPNVLDSALIGSALYMTDAKDVDFAILIDGNATDYATALTVEGFDLCSDYDVREGAWDAVRKGNLNLMITHSSEFFRGYKTAMEVCKALRLTNKADRIMVCQIVRDGLTSDQVTTRF